MIGIDEALFFGLMAVCVAFFTGMALGRRWETEELQHELNVVRQGYIRATRQLNKVKGVRGLNKQLGRKPTSGQEAVILKELLDILEEVRHTGTHQKQAD